jgi:predicted O-linked N-acetylglucosamine transferase (SPINDLY family)
MSGARLQNRLAIAFALFILLLFPLSVPAYTLKGENPQLAQLLAEANDEAFELANDADKTQVLILSDGNWLNHALTLAKMKGHVDNLDLIIEKLREAQRSGSELQEQAIDQMVPLMKKLSANTTAAINYLSQNKTRPFSEAYRQYLKKNAETAHQLSSIVSALVDYEKGMTDIERIRSKLEVSEN